MKLTTGHRLAAIGAKAAVALTVVSGAVGSVPLATSHAAAHLPAAGASRAAGISRAAGLSIVGTARIGLLRGSSGNDWIRSGPAAHVIEAGAGNDAIDAVNGRRDAVRCGPGYDQVTADRGDVVASDCEAVIRRDS